MNYRPAYNVYSPAEHGLDGIKKYATIKKSFFLESPHQVHIKNVVECL